MFLELKKIIDNSYSKYSGYKVACIIEMEDGTTFEGVNVENPSYKDGLCAEQVAIGSAITAGYKKESFKTLYVLGNGNVTPCFLCRQFIYELFKDENDIICYNELGEETRYKVKDLCPYAFKEVEND